MLSCLATVHPGSFLWDICSRGTSTMIVNMREIRRLMPSAE
ncbi:hypothetical protein PAMC26577_32255 [Caballeronia sordidicola]|uniref:Uncharacterized protein n=1 Tax=Caballeronia sordidicola TaxID=196367 RepID=A0A242MBX6_CABSO|nr:hypothetical protein PAMC26577_32255 [Caballeronia sordidicola]